MFPLIAMHPIFAAMNDFMPFDRTAHRFRLRDGEAFQSKRRCRMGTDANDRGKRKKQKKERARKGYR